MKLSKKELAEHRKEKARLWRYLSPKSNYYVPALGELWKKELGDYFGQRKNSKEELFKLLSLGMNKPKQGDLWYYRWASYTNHGHIQFDQQWIDRIQIARPDLFLTAKQKSYSRMIDMMPPEIQYKQGQEWKGTREKYWFVHKIYGPFKRAPEKLMSKRVWGSGLSGHPKEGYARGGKCAKARNSKAVRNVDTGEIFKSGRAASRSMGLKLDTVIQSIARKHRCAGFHWEYVE